MKFHLNHNPSNPGFEISHASTLFLTGSCFSENIGKLLSSSGFKIHSDPSGILFNPLSICNSLSAIIELKPFEEKYTLTRGNTSLSYLHHSSVNSSPKEELIKAIDSGIKTAHQFLIEADCLFITFGTAYYYHHKALDLAVANCHKQPAQLFEKRRLEIRELVNMYSELIQKLQKLNPNIKVIFTISPVKHLKDGLVENSLSKAILIAGVHQLIEQTTNCFYFPAYELVTDDLRDHRFYKEDLAHPNEQAIQYVWEKFSGCFFSDTTKAINEKIRKLNAGLSHRPLHQDPAEQALYQKHILELRSEILSLNPNLPL